MPQPASQPDEFSWDTVQMRRSACGGSLRNSHRIRGGFSINSTFDQTTERLTLAAARMGLSICFGAGGYEWEGSEQSESTVQLARQFTAEHDLRNVEVLQGDGRIEIKRLEWPPTQPEVTAGHYYWTANGLQAVFVERLPPLWWVASEIVTNCFGPGSRIPGRRGSLAYKQNC
jgi:hypothetical protein